MFQSALRVRSDIGNAAAPDRSFVVQSAHPVRSDFELKASVAEAWCFNPRSRVRATVAHLMALANFKKVSIRALRVSEATATMSRCPDLLAFQSALRERDGLGGKQSTARTKFQSALRVRSDRFAIPQLSDTQRAGDATMAAGSAMPAFNRHQKILSRFQQLPERDPSQTQGARCGSASCHMTAGARSAAAFAPTCSTLRRQFAPR